MAARACHSRTWEAEQGGQLETDRTANQDGLKSARGGQTWWRTALIQPSGGRGRWSSRS